MELNEVILNRRSIRKFKGEPISAKIIEQIIEAGMLAPRASNRQHCEFVVVDDKRVMERMYREAGAQRIILNAPVLIVTLYDTRFNAEHYANIQSASAAVENMLLKVHELGLGGCWIAGFGDEEILSNILNFPSRLKPLCIVLLGNPDENPFPPSRKKVEEVIHFNGYRDREGLLPLTIHSRRCTWDEIKKHQQFLSRSSHLGKDYEIYTDGEVKKIAGIVSDIINKENLTILNLFGYDGTLLRQLTPVLTGKKLIDLELSKEACEFVRYKADFPHFLVADWKIPISSQSFDIILCLFSLEKLPAVEQVLEESTRLLKEGGKIIIFLKNKISFYGLMYYSLEKIMGIKRIEDFFLSSGPFEPVFPFKLRRVMRNLKLSVCTRRLYMLPPELELFQERIGGYLRRHGKKLSIFQYLINPSISLLVFILRLTSRLTFPVISSSVCLIGKRKV